MQMDTVLLRPLQASRWAEECSRQIDCTMVSLQDITIFAKATV